MNYHEYTSITLERVDDDKGTYHVHGLPHGKGFKSVDNYVTHYAPYLKVDGVAFSTPAAEFGEYRRSVWVAQREPGDSIDILTRPPSDTFNRDAAADTTA